MVNNADNTQTSTASSTMSETSLHSEDTARHSSSEQPSMQLPAIYQETEKPSFNIETVEVSDDPRLWGRGKKKMHLLIIAFAGILSPLGANIYFPALQQIESELNTTSTFLSLTVSIYILIQGSVPVLWTSLSEVVGRKRVYIISMSVGAAGTILCALAPNIGALLAGRCVQAFGASAVLAIGAGTLSDIYAAHERGTALGLYYSFPLTGPALGPLFGGIITQYSSWRGVFWLLTAIQGFSALTFVWPFRETFRKERSEVWNRAKRHAIDHMDAEKGKAADIAIKDVHLQWKDIDPITAIFRILRYPHNIFVTVFSGLLFASSYSLSVTATAALSDPNHYNLNALKVGLCLLALGIGSIVGSVCGGRYSDYVYAQGRKRAAETGGHDHPELRLKATHWPLLILPFTYVAYGWTAYFSVHPRSFELNVAGMIICIFAFGVASIFPYSATLTYTVDSNPGRTSSAVACNSLMRGCLACIASQVALPLRDRFGDGVLYTAWAIIMAAASCLVLATEKYGESWRNKVDAKRAAHHK